MTHIDALVVGAGPAGLMAAQVMAEQGLSVLIADAKPSPARKFLMAGKSGLNLTMDQAPGAFRDTYKNPDLAPIIDAFSPSDVVGFAKDLGSETFVGSSGRVFPVAMKASPLLRAWLARLATLGVRLERNWQWQGFDQPFATPAGPQPVMAKVTVFATGGGSWARLGSDGTWADKFVIAGLPCTPFEPSNMGVYVAWSPHMVPFFGTPLKPIGLKAGEKTVTGEMVLTQRGIEGSAIYNLSPEIRAQIPITIDLIPDLSSDQTAKRLSRSKGKMSMSNHLRKALKLPSIKRALLREWSPKLPQDPLNLAKLLKALPVPPVTPFPLDEAISTAGGVRFDDLTDGLMLKQKPGMFCAGEMLDWDAPTGGYLITACFATGAWAGRHAVEYIRQLSGDPS